MALDKKPDAVKAETAPFDMAQGTIILTAVQKRTSEAEKKEDR